MATKVTKVPQWEPNEKQHRFLESKKEDFSTKTGYIRQLINKEMKKEKFE